VPWHHQFAALFAVVLASEPTNDIEMRCDLPPLAAGEFAYADVLQALHEGNML
jgi:hypothetical protein